MPKLLRRGAAVGAGLAALLATSVSPLATAAPAPSAATTSSATVTTNPVAAGAGWLATQFVDGTELPHPDGTHFGAEYGSTYYPDYGLNADVISGLAAAGDGGAKIGTALGYLRRHIHAYINPDGKGPYDGAVGKLALAAIVAGAHPRSFGGYNLLRRLHRDECRAGSSCTTPGEAANIYSSVSESFVILAEARGGAGPTAGARAYFASLQCTNGGFTSGTTACHNGAADIDATSYAIMAMQAEHAPTAAVDRATTWLRGKQRSGGYWVTEKMPNVDSTGLATAALAGVAPSSRPVRAARAWLRAQQVPGGRRGAGAFRYGGSVQATTPAATSPSVIGTAQALSGLAPMGSLAVVSAAGDRSAAPVYRPVARVAATTVQRGRRTTVTGVGFDAGERIRVTLRNGQLLRRATAGSLGVARVRYRVPRSLSAGRHVIVVHGVASGLTARHRLRVVTGAGTAAAPTHATFTAMTSTAPTHVGIVIKGKGVSCVAWHKGITGDTILNEVASVDYRSSDGMIVRIDGTPASGRADDTHYWSYWHDVNGAWHYSNSGASSSTPAAGTVEGWAYDNGSSAPPQPTAKAAGLYQSICGKQDAAESSPSPTPTPSSTPASRSATPAPPTRTTAHPAATTQPTRPARARHVRAHAATAARTARPAATAGARTAAAMRHAHRARAHHTAAGSPGASSATSSAAAAPPASPSASPERTLLVKPTAASTSGGSATPTVVAIVIVALLLAGGGAAAARRRRAG